MKSNSHLSDSLFFIFHRIMLIFLIITLKFSIILYAQEDIKKKIDTPPMVQIPGTQLLSITSSIVGQEYSIYINIPRDYNDTNKTFPVAYLIDGQWDFPLLNSIYGEQYYDGFLPGMLIVGITWGGKNPNYDFLRGRDLSPTKSDGLPQSGNAPKFLEFIKKELIPFIEAKFRTVKNDRVMIGSSFGGLFTLYTLFHETELFNRYVLTSPSLQWDKEIIFQYEKDYAEKNTKLPVRLSISLGELEDATLFKKFIDQLKKRNYEGLKLESRILENTGHSGSKAEGYSRGLQFVFSRPSIEINPAVLEQYVGNYQSTSGMKIKILMQNQHLILQAAGFGQVTPLAETEKDFYIKGLYLFIHFKKNELGKITGFQMEYFQGGEFVKKID